jgi:putative ABC transport system substrate-binding protein
MESDPVKLGLVASFARPGGNATGITDRTIELAGKRLEMFARIVPGLRRVLYPYEDSSITEREQASAYRKAARRLGIELIERVPRTQDEAKRILTGLRGKKIEGVLSPWNIGLNIPGFILDASLQQKVPAMFGFPFFVERGGLASYGPSLRSAGRLAARVIDKIIMGASPAEVPVEVNTKIQFAVNQKTAKSMGLNIAPEVLYQATRIVR